MKLSIDFAFAGIEIIKKNPVAVLLWGVVSLFSSLVTSVVMVILAGPAFMALQSYEASPPDDPMQVFAQLGALAPAGLVTLIVGLLMSSIIQCGVFRSQFQPEAGGPGFMKLGGEEIRMALVNFLWALLICVFYILFFVAMAILIGLASLVAQASGIISGLLIFLVVVAWLVGFFFIISRWSLVLVQSYAEQKINLFGSLKLTKGSGWTLLGGYALLVIVMLIIMIVVYSVVLAVTLGASGNMISAFQQMSQPDMSSLAALFSVSFIVQTLVGALLSGVFCALIYGASVAAYRVLSDKGTPSADVF